jgi:hypothetical protein
VTIARRVEARGEVTERIVAKALGYVESAAGRGTNQRFNPGEGRTAQPRARQQSPQQGSGGNAPLRAPIAREA